MQKSPYQVLNDYLLDLQRVDSLEKMDHYISEITEAANQVYPCISCKSVCYDCCTGLSMPVVYPKEWQRVRSYIKKQSKEIQEQIKTNNDELLTKHNETIKSLNKMIREKITLSEFSDFSNTASQDLKDVKCPLHINGKCSVYDVRPTKCRIFGYFLFSFDDKIQFLTCPSDSNKMSEYLKTKHIRNLALPYWNYFERKLIPIVKNEEENFDMTVIPIWLDKDYKNKLI